MKGTHRNSNNKVSNKDSYSFRILKLVSSVLILNAWGLNASNALPRTTFFTCWSPNLASAEFEVLAPGSGGLFRTECLPGRAALSLEATQNNRKS